MSIATNTITGFKALLDQVVLNQLGTYLNILKFGDMVRSLPTTMRRCNPNAAATNPYIVAGQSVAETVAASTSGASSGTGPSAGAVSPGANLLGQLPDDAKALTVLRATAIAGTSTPGSLVVDLQATNDTNFATGGTGPAEGHIGVSPSGDIVTNATDAWTAVDVTYVPDSYDVVELQLPVVAATGVCTIPAAFTAPAAGASGPPIFAMEIESLAGTTTGKFAVLLPSASLPGSTKQANLNAAKTEVLFKESDAVTSCRVKLALAKAVNVNALLEATAPVI
jgi:hypothetical protein